MSYELCYVTYGTPWNSSAMKIWNHHDAVLRDLVRDHDVKITFPLPMQGECHYSEVRAGKQSRIMKSIKKLKIDFQVLPDPTKFDGLLLELGQEFTEKNWIENGVEVTCTGDAQNEYVLRLVDKMIESNKPIFFYDPDSFAICTDLQQGGPFLGSKVIQKIIAYNKGTIASPMEFRDSVFVPFNLHPEDIAKEFKPFSQRATLSTYVGNCYFRSQFAPIFAKVAESGQMMVIGAGWTGFSHFDKVNWRGKYAVTEDTSNRLFSDCKVGLYGNPDILKKLGHYTLRVRDYICSGTFIVPENVKYFYDSFCIPEFPLTIDDIMNDTTLWKRFLDLSDNEYANLVSTQREKVLKKFSSTLYVDKYLEALEVK